MCPSSPGIFMDYVLWKKKPCAHNPRVVQGGCAEGCAGGLCRVIFGGVLEVFNTVS